MSRYYQVVEAEQVDISEAGVLPRGMKWLGDRWVYLTPHGMLWPRSGDWIVTDQTGRAAVLGNEAFQRSYVPGPPDAAGGRERWVVVEAQVQAPGRTAERPGHTASATSRLR